MSKFAPTVMQSANRAALVSSCVLTLYVCIALVAVRTIISIPYADSALFEYFGRSIVQGHRLYVEIWDNKLPGVYLFNALWYLLFGEAYYAHTVAEIGLNIATSLLFLDLCRRLRVQNAAAAALVCASLLLLWPIGLNTTENYAAFFIVLGFWSWSRGWLVMAGTTIALATFCWLPSMLAMLPMLTSVQLRRDRKQIAVAFVLALTATTLLFAIIVSPHIAIELVRSWIDYVGDSKTHRAAGVVIASRALRGIGAAGIGPLLAYLALLLGRPQTVAQRFAVWWLAASLVGACVTSNFYAHYFVPTIPAAVFAAFSFAGRPRLEMLRVIVATALIVATFPSMLSYASSRWTGTSDDPVLAEITEVLQPVAAADVAVFVQGYHPDIFLFAKIRPVDRFGLVRTVTRFAGAKSSAGAYVARASVVVLEKAPGPDAKKLEQLGFLEACNLPMPVFVRRSGVDKKLAAAVVERCSAH